jgi:hypothetical protein
MRKLIGLMALMAALGVLGGSATTNAYAGSLGCFANDICVYNGEYDSFLSVEECSQSGLVMYVPGFVNGSARNRCGNKTGWLRLNGNAVKCLNPGADAPNPPAFNELWIAAQYGAFC